MTATQTLTKTPVTAGAEVMIPAGELITNDTYMGYMPAPTGLTIKIKSTFAARDDDHPFSDRSTHIPGTIVWKDDAGGFRSAKVTPAMVAQNPALDFTGLA